jgi:cytochrome b
MAAARSDSGKAGLEPVRVWDWPVRTVHWLLVLLVVTSWVTSQIGGNAMTYHMWSGYTILTLVLFRIVWGFVGSRHARFANFLKGPAEVMRYATGRSGSAPVLGHNPLGGWSVALMLLSLTVQAGTGLFANDEILTEGPLASHVSTETSNLLTAVHHYNFYVLAVLIALHIAAILYYLLVKRENLIAAMFTGRKYVQGLVTAPASIAGSARAVTVLVIVAAAVAALVNWGWG